jgi:hypothetical protein
MKGNIESQLAEDYYNNVGVDLSYNGNSFELKAGVPLVTKYPKLYGNAVVHSVLGDGDSNRNPVRILTDFGNLLIFPSVEDVMVYWEVGPIYHNVSYESSNKVFCLRDRLKGQIELLTNALEGLN